MSSVTIQRRIIEASLGQEDWLDAIESMRTALNADVLLLSRREAKRGEILVSHQSQMDPDAHRRYQAGYFASDPWSSHFCKATTDETRLSQEIIRDNELTKTLYYNEFLRSTRIRHGLFSVSSLNKSEFDALSFFRYSASIEFDEIDKHKSQRIYQTLRSVSSNHLTNSHASLILDCFNLSLTSVGRMVIVLTPSGRVLCVSEKAESLLSSERVAIERNGILYGIGPNDEDLFINTCNELLNGKTSKIDVLIHSNQAKYPYYAEARIIRSNPPYSRVILFYISDPNDDTPPNAEKIGRTFGLSRRESEVAQNLFLGKSTAEIAERHGVNVETIRKQIKSIFLKTNVNSQSQLIRIISSLR